MKPTRLLPLILLALVLTGCGGTPKSRTYAFRQSYVATLTGIDELVLTNHVTPQRAVEIQKLRPIGDAAEKAVITLQASGGSSFDAAIDAANAVLTQLIAIQTEAKKGK